MIPKACLEPHFIREWLDDSLPTEIESRFTEHLEHCESCRRATERLAVEQQPFTDFEQQLKGLAQASVPRKQNRDTGHDPENVDKALQLLGPTDDPAMLGRLGRFEVSGVIGSGATSFVYKGFDMPLNRPIALKLLSPALSHLVASRKRFQREGRAIASVRDLHVVDVHGVESHNDMPFIVMQYIAGGSLQSRLDRDGYLSTEEVTRVGLQVAKGLAAAHAQGIIHRDIKPSNVLMESGGDRAIVSDFGLARVVGDAAMTHTGMIAGTPQYMSPEQAEGGCVDHRSDLFSLGCVLYTCCTGVAPFRHESILAVLRAVSESEPTPVRQLNPQIAPWLEAFIEKLMAKKPSNRFQTAEHVASLLSDELATLQSGEQKGSPERIWWRANRSIKESQRSHAKKRLAAFAFSILIVSVLVLTLWDRTYNANRIAQAVGLVERSQGRFPEGSHPNLTPIAPTEAESSFIAAKAAYELSYETHVQEANLSGDMHESIQSHKQAMRLGYDPARSAFHLARAYAIEGRVDEAIEVLELAVNAGFCDSEALRSHRDLRRIRDSQPLAKLMARVVESESELERLRTTYFDEADYVKAAELAKRRLAKHPNDEYALLLLAGAATEIAFVDPSQIAIAKRYNERIRNSVRYANFGSYNLGCIALMEGQTQLALDYLYYTASTGFTDVDHLVNDPMLAALRDNPRFTALVESKLRP